MEKGGNYYEFQYNTRLVKPTILHFQVCECFLLSMVVMNLNTLSHSSVFLVVFEPVLFMSIFLALAYYAFFLIDESMHGALVCLIG